MPSRKAVQPIARLFRPGEWSIELTNGMVWRSKDAPLLREAIQSRWSRTDSAPQHGNVVEAFVEQMAREFGCECWVRPEPPLADGEYRIY